MQQTMFVPCLMSTEIRYIYFNRNGKQICFYWQSSILHWCGLFLRICILTKSKKNLSIDVFFNHFFTKYPMTSQWVFFFPTFVSIEDNHFVRWLVCLVPMWLIFTWLILINFFFPIWTSLFFDWWWWRIENIIISNTVPAHWIIGQRSYGIIYMIFVTNSFQF